MALLIDNNIRNFNLISNNDNVLYNIENSGGLLISQIETNSPDLNFRLVNINEESITGFLINNLLPNQRFGIQQSDFLITLQGQELDYIENDSNNEIITNLNTFLNSGESRIILISLTPDFELIIRLEFNSLMRTFTITEIS